MENNFHFDVGDQTKDEGCCQESTNHEQSWKKDEIWDDGFSRFGVQNCLEKDAQMTKLMNILKPHT